ncbi:alpha/beta hydrolase [Acinetobacter cumulans]|uniref:Alpha/beta hydrolase n=2 Tax=Acinetobacter cumulans TaxID=2136182 RepID=A0ABX9U8S5_9GAMM|nr:alpha/beta hydrolase [Acinetobacter cumulans]RLL48939.1 alpha/beta hydrolase [Acinetobacter cumulans]
MIILSILLMLQLSACQSTKSNSRVIAGVFNASTQIQKKFIDRHAPQHIKVYNNIPYMQTPELGLDLYQSAHVAQFAPRPVIVWIHGGGWISGDKEHARGYFKRLADAGYNVVSVQYQFAPEAVYPAQLHQINQAVGYIQKHAAEYHLNAQQIFLAGDSAGANMASHYAGFVSNPVYAKAQNFEPVLEKTQLKGVILHCGIYDLSAFVQTAPEEMKLLEWGIVNLVQAYTGDRMQDTAFLDAISPRQHLSSAYPPVFISGGNKDFLTESQSMPFVQSLKQANVPVTEVFYPDSKELLVHEYQFMMGKKASRQTLQKTIEFLAQYAPEDHLETALK